MTSQETINFVEDKINYILTKWDDFPSEMKPKVRLELMSVFISFVGALNDKPLNNKPLNNKPLNNKPLNKKHLNDKHVIGIHLC